MKIVAWTLLAVLLGGCASLRNAGNDLGSGLGEGISADADSIGIHLGAGVVLGARDTLTSAMTQKRLADMIDLLGAALARQATTTRDTLLGEYTRAWIDHLRTTLLGAQTRDDLGALRDELLGHKTTAFLQDSLRRTVAVLRSELLGTATRSALDSIINESLSTLSLAYREKMQPLLRSEESFLQRNITAILFSAGGIVAATMLVAAYLQWRKTRDRRILSLLTYQIHEIPDQKAYDELVTRIRRKAQEEGLEPGLAEMLRERGILGKDAWIHPDMSSAH
jgi:hypothetical protein